MYMADEQAAKRMASALQEQYGKPIEKSINYDSSTACTTDLRE
jgi:hypothetical protein